MISRLLSVNRMNINLDIQRAVEALPSDEDFNRWIEQTLTSEMDEIAAAEELELTIRIVDVAESAQLNQQYRHKTGATNVLSFPFEAPEEVELNLLGDLVICTDIVHNEAEEQHKEELAHWAHMVVHGTLHLLGYDHITDAQANIMEAKEIKILSQLGYTDPYREIE